MDLEILAVYEKYSHAGSNCEDWATLITIIIAILHKTEHGLQKNGNLRKLLGLWAQAGSSEKAWECANRM